MIRNNYQKTRMLIAWFAVSAVFLMPVSVFPQTKLTLHSNKYSVQDDIKLGRQAAAEAEQQFPLLRDGEVSSYVERVGNREGEEGIVEKSTSYLAVWVLLRQRLLLHALRISRSEHPPQRRRASAVLRDVESIRAMPPVF